MKKCKCIKTTIHSFKVGEYFYYYKIINGKNLDELYPYQIYRNINGNVASGSFSVEYFNIHFIDVNINRKNKLKKINGIIW